MSLKVNQRLVNYLYLIGVAMVCGGVVVQIIKTYSTKSVGDIALGWLILLVIGEILVSPRIFSSIYWVWKAMQVTVIILFAILLVGVILYR